MTPTNTHLDAETLAAWVDGGLNPNEAAMAEAHVSSCDRCQEIVGLIMKTTPVAAAAEAPWPARRSFSEGGWRRFRAGWLVPLTAGVAAVGLWMIVPSNQPAQPEPAVALSELGKAKDAIAPSAQATPAAPAEAKPDQQALKQETAGARDRALASNQAPRLNAPKEEEKRLDLGAAAVADQARVAAAPPAVGRVEAAREAGAPAREAFAQAVTREAISPDGSLRWRITDRGSLEKSSDGGSTWDAVQTGITVALASVQAPEPRTAIITTVEGGQFRTTDAGATWRPVGQDR